MISQRETDATELTLNTSHLFLIIFNWTTNERNDSHTVILSLTMLQHQLNIQPNRHQLLAITQTWWKTIKPSLFINY